MAKTEGRKEERKRKKKKGKGTGIVVVVCSLLETTENLQGCKCV